MLTEIENTKKYSSVNYSSLKLKKMILHMTSRRGNNIPPTYSSHPQSAGRPH